jgi:hypothetical protein
MGAQLAAQTVAGETLLQHSVRYGHHQVAQVLFNPLREEGADSGGTGLFSTSRPWCRQLAVAVSVVAFTH